MSELATSASARRPRRAGRAFGILARDRGAMIGLGIILALVVVAVFAPVIAPYDPKAQSLLNTLRPPSTVHWLGTDDYGRDVLSRLIWGTRPALTVGVVAVLFAMAIGIPIGIMAGFWMGWFDRVTGWCVDIMLSFPSLLLALMIVALLGSSLPVLIVAIGASSIPSFIRLARSMTLTVKNNEFISASRSFGASDLRIMARHVFPNIMGPIIVMGTLGIASAIREEASLSFLGLGVQPPDASWGNIIRDGLSYVLQAPWLAVAPGLMLTLSVLAFNMLGDTVRDMFDPRDLASTATKKTKT
ncbi:ABC transporter permease [Halodurantibacterium flavum]|uniref:ABC transporter permease n=1 Tax=Halodurantibacterium flavum TaxID=1382802 RepID=A0ABW4RZP9_9RHOB